MKITIAGPNLPTGFDKGTFVAHTPDCADLAKLRKRVLDGDTYFDTVEVATRLEVAEYVYPRGEFEWDSEDMYVDDIWFAPCLDALPEKGENVRLAADRPEYEQAIADSLRIPDCGHRHTSWPQGDVDAILASLKRAGFEVRPRTLFNVGTAPAQLDPDKCRCVQMWPGRPCGYCHERREEDYGDPFHPEHDHI